MAEFSTRTIVPADGVKLPAVNENLANPSGNMTLSSLKSYVLGTLPTEVQTNTEDIGENTSDIEGIRGSSQAFDATAAYSAGDYCIYENVLYRFTSAKSAGAWDSTIVTVVDLPTLDGAITSLISLIWTNPNPTSDFPAGDINIDLSPYKLVVILCGEYKAATRHQLTVGICPVGESCTVFAPYISYDSAYDSIRNYTARHISTTTSKITVGNTYSDTSGVHNYGNCLPLFIYGIK